MNLHERLRQLATALPSDNSSVTFSRADLMSLLEGSGGESERISRAVTTEDVAREVERAPSTVRSWLNAGRLRGYKLNGRAWRIPRTALQDYLNAQGRRPAATSAIEEQADGGVVDISAWRRHI